jgi:hypothetical protein
MTDIKVGDLVDYHGIIGGSVTSIGHVVTKIIEEPNNFGIRVAFITWKTGCVAVAALTPASSLEAKKMKVLKGLHCLYLTVDSEIVDNVQKMVKDLIVAYEEEIRRCQKLKN